MTSRTTVSITTPMTPPRWALLEREVIRAQARACEEFFEHYFDERGYLLCVPRWSGDDGADDAAENFANWTTLHALGAPDVVLELYKRAWDGHIRQYTEAKTVDVPFARDGMYFKEFPVMFDWMHTGEGLTAFMLEGLSDPHDRKLIARTRRFAGFYMGDDAMADNYDPDRKLIRSMFSGSRGPMLRKSTAVDWAGDPIEVEGRFTPLHGESSYEQMLEHFKDYNDVAGDHPLNLGTTTLALNAYMLTGEERYRDWALEYVDAWMERFEANGGIIPTNIGLDGTIGGECGGRWYGGVYGWAHSTLDPATNQIRHRPSFQIRSHYGFANALLLTGDRRYVEPWSRMIDLVNENSKTVDGRTVYPHMYGDEGWYDYTPEPFDAGALQSYYWTMDRRDLDRLPMTGWTAYLHGKDPDYPERALTDALEDVRSRMEDMYRDTASEDTRMSDDPNRINPALVGSLIELMLGGLPTAHEGYPLHSRLRYFDPKRRRAGIPEDVAALVDELTADSVSVTLVNVNQVEARTVVVQGGAHSEHQVLTASAGDQETPVDAGHFTVRLAPGAGGRLVLRTRRYANSPTLAFPWV